MVQVVVVAVVLDVLFHTSAKDGHEIGPGIVGGWALLRKQFHHADEMLGHGGHIDQMRRCSLTVVAATTAQLWIEMLAKVLENIGASAFRQRLAKLADLV